MFRCAKGDVALLHTLYQLMFWKYIALKKERLVLVVFLFLNDTSFKTLEGGSFYRKIFQNFVFHVLLYKLYNLLHAVDCFPCQYRANS